LHSVRTQNENKKAEMKLPSQIPAKSGPVSGSLFCYPGRKIVYL